MRYLRTVVLLLGLVQITLSYPITSARDCAGCHTQTWQQWSKSRHSQANTNPLYLAMLDLEGANPVSDCFICHEPVNVLDPTNNDPALELEGVTCDVCHAFKVSEKRGQYQFEPVTAKIGPYKDPVATNHLQQHESMISESEFCLACHNNNQQPHGTAFIDIEREWKNSPYYDMDIHCQDCHVTTTKGKTAPAGNVRDIYNHLFPGGFTPGMIKSCVTMNSEIVKSGSDLIINITLENSKAGHAVPTASPFRMLVLTIEALNDTGKTVWRNYRYDPIKESPKTVFMKLLQDNNGQSPATPWDAVGERFDSRLFPGNPKVIKFSAPLKDIFSVRLSLDYHYAPPSILRKLHISDKDFTTPVNISTVEYAIE